MHPGGSGHADFGASTGRGHRGHRECPHGPLESPGTGPHGRAAARPGRRPAGGFRRHRESKLALLQSDLCWITNTSPRGGSPVAAAAVNALATMAEEE